LSMGWGLIRMQLCSGSCTDVREEVDRPVDRERVMTKTEEFHSLV
jgi:hypothetical protein